MMSEREKEKEKENRNNNIIDTGSVTAKSHRGTIHCITVVGQIEGHQELPSETKTTKYEHILPQLAAIEESDEIDGLLILLNTIGGDVEAGLAIAELIAGMKTPTVSLVLGGGHSIGVPLAVAAQKCFIARSASMTIHPVRMTGMIIGVPQTLLHFQKIQERIDNFIILHSHIDQDVLHQLMMETGELANDIGSVISGEEAVEYGICNQVGGLSDALEALHEMIDERNKLKDKSTEEIK